MRVCLVTAPTVGEFADAEEMRSPSVRESALAPQLGILSLAAVLEHSAEPPHIVNLNRTFLSHSTSSGGFRQQEFVEIAAKTIAASEANLYGFSTICNSYPLTLRIARAVQLLLPEAKILFGGPQASVVDVQTLAAFPFVDFILRGEAEHNLPILLEQLEQDCQLHLVPGLTFRRCEGIQRNPNSKVIEDLDALPSPAYHLTDELRGAKRAALELGRGCPFACTFCSTNDFFRRNFRLRSPNRLLSDMRWLSSLYSVHDFDLVHDMFTVDRRRVVAFCEAMIASGDSFTWSCSARTDRIDEELLELMSKAGCRGIFFGVEAGSERMQQIIDKRLDPERAKQVIDATERAGIRSTVSLITGFPEETQDDLRQTMHVFMHSARAPKSHPQLNLLAPLAGTPIYSLHKHELLLEELCSGMSHQGKCQNTADLQLIRDYPEIFPNFYVIPPRHLDWRSLCELREFALMGAARFRWLLVAIHQSSSGIAAIFGEWHQFRLRKRPELAGPSLRHYYRTDTFETDFLFFVKSHSSASASKVKALLDYECSIRRDMSGVLNASPRGRSRPSGLALRLNDRPARKINMVIVELCFDLQRLIESLKNGRDDDFVGSKHFYVTRAVSVDTDRLDEVSDWMAYLLRLCNGRRTIKEIIKLLSAKLLEVDRPNRNYACMRLINAARAENLIDIYRAR
jgi:biotin synthase-like enzyme